MQDIRNPELWHPLTDEEYIEIKLVNEKYQLKSESIGKEQLKEKGIEDYVIRGGYFRSKYRQKFYSALSEQNITVEGIPEYLSNLPVKSNTEIQQREKPDIYEQTIRDFFEKYKNNSLEKTHIFELEFIKIEDAISKGHFCTEKLLEFSEQLQSLWKRNFIQFYKRVYRYGRKYGAKGFRTVPPIKKEIDAVRVISEFFEKGYTIQDLGETPEHFLEKLKYSLKQKINEDTFAGYDGNRYYGEYEEL